jgi:S1-C subfamily serine protease
MSHTNHPYLITLLALLTILPAASHAAKEPDQTCVVRISVTHQANDPFLPWQKGNPAGRSGIGIAVDDTHILVPEPLIRRATLIEMQRAREGTKFQARLVHADIQAGLALLACPSNALIGVRTPVMAETLPIDATVQLVKLDDTREPERGKGTVTRAMMDSIPGSPYQAFIMKIQTEMHPEDPGAAVLLDEALAGMVMGYNSSERSAQIIPIQAIRPFITQVLSDTYKGIASAGFVWQPLVDPAKRDYLHVADREDGVQIKASLPGFDAEAVLQPEDVLISWNAVPIDALGFIAHPDYGRLRLSYLIRNEGAPGDTAEAQVMRNGKLEHLTLKLGIFDDWESLIPENSTDLPEPYIVEGGIILRELSGRFIQAHGRNWKTRLDPRLVHTYLANRLLPEQPGDRVVILHRVLSDEVNIGYQHFSYTPIEKINGQPIRNLADAIAIRKADGLIHHIKLQSHDVAIALPADSLAEANARIQRNYQIPSLMRAPDAAR